MNQTPDKNQQPRQLETDTPTYDELLESISNVENEVEAQDYMIYSYTKEQQVMDEVLEPQADAAHTPVDESYPQVNQNAADTVFSHPADDAVLARQTNGSIPKPNAEAQGLDNYIVPPDNALADNDGDEARHHHENQPYSPANLNGGEKPARQEPLDAYPAGDSAPYYSAPEEGDGPGTPTPQQDAGWQGYNGSPDDAPQQ